VTVSVNESSDFTVAGADSSSVSAAAALATTRNREQVTTAKTGDSHRRDALRSLHTSPYYATPDPRRETKTRPAVETRPASTHHHGRTKRNRYVLTDNREQVFRRLTDGCSARGAAASPMLSRWLPHWRRAAARNHQRADRRSLPSLPHGISAIATKNPQCAIWASYACGAISRRPGTRLNSRCCRSRVPFRVPALWLRSRVVRSDDLASGRQLGPDLSMHASDLLVISIARTPARRCSTNALRRARCAPLARGRHGEVR